MGWHRGELALLNLRSLPFKYLCSSLDSPPHMVLNAELSWHILVHMSPEARRVSDCTSSAYFAKSSVSKASRASFSASSVFARCLSGAAAVAGVGRVADPTIGCGAARQCACTASTEVLLST
jgi:hypothetical protein